VVRITRIIKDFISLRQKIKYAKKEGEGFAVFLKKKITGKICS